MIFSNLFHRKKNKESETGSFSQYDQSEYAKLETKNIVKELNLSDAAQAKKYVVDLCKQMIQASKDIEDSKSEYQLVTNYLTDIQILEDLTDAERKPILECATQVAKLEKQRTDFLKTKRRLTDTQFAQMQEEEENLPGVIRRLKANEADLDAIKRNMAYLEGKKLKFGNKMNFYTHEAQQILLDDSLFDLPYFTGCQAGNGVCCIKANGDILPCVLLGIPIGNIRENSFSTIWLNSPILEELNNRQKYSEPCVQCIYVEKCGGCRGVAYGSFGDFFAPDPHCWLDSNGERL